MRRYLVVEDYPAMATALWEVLQRPGEVAVDLCGDAEDALGWLRTVSYDLVIADVNLPEANGGELVIDVRRAGHLNRYSKIILISGENARLSFLSAACGADGYLSKPFTSEDLASLVATLLSKPSLNSASR